MSEASLVIHDEAHVLDRRRKIAALMLRGLSQREIQRALPMEPNPVFNRETGKPYGIGTIHRDQQALKAEWKLSALEDLIEHKARHLAELQEVRRAAWNQNKLFYVLKSLEQEADVLGLKDLPEVPGISVNVTNFDFSGVPEDDLDKLERVLDAVIVEGPGATRAIEGEPQEVPREAR